jgi:hypothetical protein
VLYLRVLPRGPSSLVKSIQIAGCPELLPVDSNTSLATAHMVETDLVQNTEY